MAVVDAKGLTQLRTGYMARALSHDLHFRHAGAGVGGGDIAPAEAFDKITHGLE